MTADLRAAVMPGPADVRLPPGPGVDWTVVRRLRREVAVRLGEETTRLARTRGVDLSGADVRMLGRQLVLDAVSDWVSTTGRDTGRVPDTATEDALTAAVLAALFGLGRLQPLVDDPRVENIDVDGCDRVWVSYADGTAGPGPAVADSDTELVELVQTFAAYLSATAREFSSAHPLLTLRLPDGSRLAAWMSVTARPGLTIRRHRLSTATLADLVEAREPRRRVGGLPRRRGAGPEEHRRHRRDERRQDHPRPRAGRRDRPARRRSWSSRRSTSSAWTGSPDRHRQVVSMEARDANAEGAGEVALASLVVHALRMNAAADHRRRGPRRRADPDAHRDGVGQRRVAVHPARQQRPRGVQPDRRDRAGLRRAAPGRGRAPARRGRPGLRRPRPPLRRPGTGGHSGAAGLGGRRRYVSQVLEVLDVGEAGRVTTNEVYAPGPDGRAQPAYGVRCLDDLVAAGFDPAHLDGARPLGGHLGLGGPLTWPRSPPSPVPSWVRGCWRS